MTYGADAVTGEPVPNRTAQAPGPPAAARRAARLLTWSAIALFWIVLAVLTVVADVSILDAVLLSVLLAVVPMLGIAQVPLVEHEPIDRLPAYWSSILTLWVIGTACWLVGTRGSDAAALGLTGLPLGALVAWSAALTVAGLAIIAAFHVLARALRLADSRLLVALLPRTRRERTVFAVLSVAAGTGEELAYRGYSIGALAPLLGASGAAVLTSVVFGVVHAYQGTLGIVRTGLMGGVLAWGFLASGSLWPAIVAHTAIDLIAGIALGDRLVVGPTD